ncbi:MAG: hypothetical protein DCF18_14415 [Cyanobium sp.]|nr:MAG: hypothetical protein DCF18_14415 [Cyanobium sp.]
MIGSPLSRRHLLSGPKILARIIRRWWRSLRFELMFKIAIIYHLCLRMFCGYSLTWIRFQSI